MHYRPFIFTTICLLIALVTVACSDGQEPIKVGVLHSQTGTMAISEVPVVEATLMAIDEVNASGGVLGRRLEPVVVDGESDWGVFAREAEQLLIEDKVAVVFGCWTSASRKTVKPIFEKHDGLLFYPVQYEGIEQSPNIVYTGAAPNQQIIPAVSWAYNTLGKRRFFLVGSDYVFPRSANAIIRDYVTALGAEIVGEEYIPLGSRQVDHAIEAIRSSQPDVILNTINGDSNIPFFQALRTAGIKPADIPTFSFSIAEPELQSLDLTTMVGDYAAWNYFQSVDSPANKKFVEDFRKRYGADRVVSDPLEAAYFGVHLWARAAQDAGSIAPEDVRAAVRDMSFEAPGGMVYVDHENLHTWKVVRIGQINEDAQFKIVWSSDEPVRPVPFPRTRTRAAWDEFLARLYADWDGHWAAPARKED
ncbi:urea ABC transporter substrate-binding protein [bacterium]|nr:urea ABC transporter substrate-binding protein [bacterium]